MNQNNKNSQLNKEDFLKLLESISSHQSKETQNLDEFEKEALEGYITHSSHTQAKKLNEQIEALISQRVVTQSKLLNNKLIWLGVAATFAILITISIVFFLETASQDNLAVNTTHISQEELNKTTSDVKQENVTTVDVSKDGAVVSRQEESKPTVTNATLPVSKNQELGVAGVAGVAESSTMVSENRSNNVEKDEVLTPEQDKPQAVAIEKETNDEQDAKLDSRKSEAGLMGSKKSIKQKDLEAPPVEKSSSSLASSAFYTGGQEAITLFVVNYFKTHHPKMALTQSYQVIATVNVSGTLKVFSIKPLKQDECKCIAELTKALEAMKDWNPEKYQGVKRSSTVNFTLSF